MADFVADANRVVDHIRETGRPVVLTTDGRAVAVLLSFSAFEEIQAVVEQSGLQQSIDEAERGLAEGRWVEHAEVEAKLKRWAAGGS